MTPTWTDRFWAKVNKNGPPAPAYCGDIGRCWEWTAALRGPYGCMTIQKVTTDAHRLAWEMAYGSIPDNLCVLHRCDNPPCVRATHLFLGTREDNNKDRSAKGRTRSGVENLEACRPKGHPFTAENTIWFHDGKHRKCRACQNDLNREWMRNYRQNKSRG